MKYRPEIDGLRAVAVLPVILFHAGFDVFSGGYIGVDIFFVISGYLITTIIMSELATGQFSLVNFYERRARRILPALFFVIFCTLPFAWMWLTPRDMKDFAESIFAVVTFSSNFLFLVKSGYFDTAAELKPLLHTWSLAVEEQYYILFPLLLMAVWRLGQKFVLAILTALFVISLSLAHWVVFDQPAAAFFLLPTRGWELLLGGFCALYYDRVSLNYAPIINQLLSALGLFVILYAVFFFNEFTPTPSLFTLIPTGGAALLILFASRETIAHRLLSTRLFVGIGLISYSAYLWHQPIFAFWRHAPTSSDFNQNLAQVILIIAAILLAVITFKFVEKPFRDKGSFSRKKIFTLSFAGICILGTLAIWGYTTKGIPDRLPTEVVKFLADFDNNGPDGGFFERNAISKAFRNDCNFYDSRNDRTNIPFVTISDDCFQRDQSKRHSVLLWGDSHAQMLRYGLDHKLPATWQVLQIASSDCRARIVLQDSKTHYCERSNFTALETIRTATPEVVIIAQFAHHTLENMNRLRDDLQKIGVKRVLFVGPAPHWLTDLPQIVALKLWGSTKRRTSLYLDTHISKLDANLDAGFEQSKTAAYVSLIGALCNTEGCLTHLSDDRTNGITSWDYGHLTPISSAYVAETALVPAIVNGF